MVSQFCGNTLKGKLQLKKKACVVKRQYTLEKHVLHHAVLAVVFYELPLLVMTNVTQITTLNVSSASFSNKPPDSWGILSLWVYKGGHWDWAFVFLLQPPLDRWLTHGACSCSYLIAHLCVQELCDRLPYLFRVTSCTRTPHPPWPTPFPAKSTYHSYIATPSKIDRNKWTSIIRTTT